MVYLWNNATSTFTAYVLKIKLKPKIKILLKDKLFFQVSSLEKIWSVQKNTRISFHFYSMCKNVMELVQNTFHQSSVFKMSYLLLEHFQNFYFVYWKFRQICMIPTLSRLNFHIDTFWLLITLIYTLLFHFKNSIIIFNMYLNNMAENEFICYIFQRNSSSLSPTTLSVFNLFFLMIIWSFKQKFKSVKFCLFSNDKNLK